MMYVEVYVVAFFIILLTKWIYRWRNPKCINAILPPGSSGIPLIGEGLQYNIPNYSLDVHPFIKERLQRYGPMFRTHVLGRNVVVTSDEEINHMIFQQDEKLVESWFVDPLGKLFEQAWEGRPDAHSIRKYMRNLVPRHFGVECLKKDLLALFEQHVKTTIHSWALQDCVDCRFASIAMFREFGAKQLYSYDTKRSEQLKDMMADVIEGVASLPLYIPGTAYYNALKSKEKLMKIMRNIVNERLASPQNVEDDLLSKMIKDMNTLDFLTPEILTNFIFALPFIAFFAIPPTLAFALKFIAENPPVLNELKAEHEEILGKRKNHVSPITWDDYKSMTFTIQVINETLRLTNSLPGMFRKAVKDIKVKGYTIPAGWGIIVSHSAVHLDPKLYKDPLKFDPWRWKHVKSEFMSKTFKPFGGGIMQCPGADFTRASMCIFLHVLVTRYRWTIVKGGEVVQNPTLRFKDELFISISGK